MRLGEECPYITPCGWCSRKNIQCDNRPRKEVRLPRSKYPSTPPGEKKNAGKNDCIRQKPVLE